MLRAKNIFAGTNFLLTWFRAVHQQLSIALRLQPNQ